MLQLLPYIFPIVLKSAVLNFFLVSGSFIMLQYPGSGMSFVLLLGIILGICCFLATIVEPWMINISNIEMPMRDILMLKIKYVASKRSLLLVTGPAFRSLLWIKAMSSLRDVHFTQSQRQVVLVNSSARSAIMYMSVRTTQWSENPTNHSGRYLTLYFERSDTTGSWHVGRKIDMIFQDKCIQEIIKESMEQVLTQISSHYEVSTGVLHNFFNAM